MPGFGLRLWDSCAINFRARQLFHSTVCFDWCCPMMSVWPIDPPFFCAPLFTFTGLNSLGMTEEQMVAVAMEQASKLAAKAEKDRKYVWGSHLTLTCLCVQCQLHAMAACACGD